MGKPAPGTVVNLFSLAVVADGLNRAAIQCFLSLLTFGFGFRLVKRDAETNVVIAFENRWRSFAAHITVNARVGDVEGSGNIFREAGSRFSHNFIRLFMYS